MPRARLGDTIIAESDATLVVEGNHYFPPDALVRAHFEPSEKRTVCGWKGTAHYYHVATDERRCEDAAWFYPDPKDAAAEIRDHVAFWGDVVVEG